GYDVADVEQTGRELALILHDLGTVLDHSRHRTAVQVFQIEFPYLAADKRGVVLDTIIGPAHIRREVGFDLEQLLEILVEIEECLVQRLWADQNDFDIKWYRFRPEARGRYWRHLIARIFNLY